MIVCLVVALLSVFDQRVIEAINAYTDSRLTINLELVYGTNPSIGLNFTSLKVEQDLIEGI